MLVISSIFDPESINLPAVFGSRRFCRCFLPILVLLTGAPVGAWAQTGDETERAGTETTLDTTVVTGRRTASRLEDTPQRIEVIDKKDIERTPIREFADILKKNASVDIIQYPANTSGIGIRGFRPDTSETNKHTLVLMDGRPVMATSLALINPGQVERVEVLKGPASALYGSSAMGGVVNIITRKSRGKIGGAGQLGYGACDTREIKGRVGWALNSMLDFDYSGSFFEQNDDFRMGNGKRRPNTGLSQQFHALRLGLNFNPDWRLDLRTDIYRGRDIANPGDLSNGTNSQSNKDVDRDGTDISLEGRLGDHRLRFTAFSGKEAYDSYKKTSTTASELPYLPFRSYGSENEWHGWQIQDVWAWSDNASLVFGVDQDTTKAKPLSYNVDGTRKAPSSANNDRRTLGLYAEHTWYLNDGNTTFHAGLRHDRITVRTLNTYLLNNFTPGSADFTTTNPSVGFKHLLGAGWRIHGSAGRAFVPPSASELTGTGHTIKTGKDDILSGNPDLDPENSVSWDLGLEWSHGDWFVDLTWFSTRVKDKIVRTQVGEDADNNYFSYVNANDASMQGLEWEGRWRATPWLRLSLNGTYYDHRKEKINGEYLPVRNVPRLSLRAAADIDHGAWSGRLGLRHVGTWVDNDWQGNSAQYVDYDPFTTVDLSVAYRFDRHQSVGVLVDNVGDVYYAEKGGYPLAGRSFRVNYRYEF